MDDALAVAAHGVTKRFGEVVAVDDISIEVAAGEVYGVLGPNGAGKTTFLRMVFGLIRADRGQIEIFGRTWQRDGVRTLDGVAGFIESPRFYPYLSGRENLRALALLDGRGVVDRTDEALDIVGLADRADRKVGGYSYGMKQRLGVAASLLRDPRLLILDEPANGLDPAGIRDMRALVKRLADTGLTVLLSSHHMDEVEEICDNVTIMRAGQVAFHGTLRNLRSLAPDPGYLLRTDADAVAQSLATLFGLDATPADDGLRVAGPRAAISRLVAEMVARGHTLEEFVATRTPLESLFFMLTDGASAAEAADAAEVA
jgi:ABC-2 type transport system ATP-binding protein